MKKYETYLPLKYNDGREIEAEKIKQIREELIAIFGALTVSSQSVPYQGSWKRIYPTGKGSLPLEKN